MITDHHDDFYGSYYDPYYDEGWYEEDDWELWEDELGYDPCVEYENWCIDHPFLAWLDRLRSWLRWWMRELRQGFFEVCCECKQPEQILWHKVGDHSDCLPF